MTERPRNRAKPIRNVAEKPPWSLFLQFVFAIHGSRQQSRLALGIALPCHCPAMLPRCSGHAESISLNRILTYLFWSEPRYKYVCGFVAHSELYRFVSQSQSGASIACWYLAIELVAAACRRCLCGSESERRCTERNSEVARSAEYQ